MPRSLPLAALALALAALPRPSRASFDFSPIIASLSPAGGGSSVSFSVKNDLDRKIPVQVYVVHRDPDEKGLETYKETPDIEGLFQVYPSQIVLNARERRTVRVNWIGDPRPKRELSFRIIAEELPFSVEDPGKVYKKPVGEITITSRYIGSLYVTPPGARSELEVRAGPTQDSPPRMSLRFENRGTAHQLLQGLKVKIASLGKKNEIELSREHLPGLQNQNILAGKARDYVIAWPQGVPVGPVKVTLALPKQ